MDCSLNDKTIYNNFIDFKKKIYEKLIYLQNIIEEKPLKDQLLKSINIIMHNNDIASLLTIEDVGN